MRRHPEFLITILVQFSYICSLYAEGVLFAKENIEVTILSQSSIQVRGEYFFIPRENKPSFSSLLYPFPLDSLSAWPCSISVRDMGSSGAVPFSVNERGLTFFVKVNPGDTTGIEIVYRQEVKKQRGRYILTTTSCWGRFLENSSYSVKVSSKYVLDYMSYECDSVSIMDGFTVYQFFRKRFMPDRDLSFSWSADSLH